MTTFRSPPPSDVLLRRSQRAVHSGEFDFAAPIDRTLCFVCPTTTPLYYTQAYHELSPQQQRRYNQLTALSFSELIAFFEATFTSSVQAVLFKPGRSPLTAEMADCLSGFVADERKHLAWWGQLNRLSEPRLYADAPRCVIRIPALVHWLLQNVASRPKLLPVVFWVMLALEERSLDISGRTLRAGDAIEPRYRAIYREHLLDETRHVQLDQHLIERFYAPRALMQRRCNAWLLRQLIVRALLPPTRAAVRVIELLSAEHPELQPRRQSMLRQLQTLSKDSAYQRMMFSRQTTPKLFALFDRFEEMHAMQRVLQAYTPTAERK